MKDRIDQRFRENIARVRNLVDIYSLHLSGSGGGRRGHSKTDVLRAAVVLLHAATEDLLRSLAYWKLPLASSEVLSKIPLITAAPAVKFSLGDLSFHRGKNVDSVISDSVNGYLERSNYNNTDEVASLLSHIGVPLANVNSQFNQLAEVMARRHLIVHRADRGEKVGKGNHSVQSIGKPQVSKWIDSVEAFGNVLLDQIAD
ncbi:MAG: HEPN domain-containing protein [Gammaproteobacteria bacterium]